MKNQQHFSQSDARRIALAAQGFGQVRTASKPSVAKLRTAIKRMGILQLDFVNVLIPAHQFVIFSRLGPFDYPQFHRLVYDSGEYIEHWAHEASIVPADYWPLLRYRRDEFKPWPNSPIMKLRGRNRYLANVLDQIKTSGAVTSRDLPAVKGPKRKPGDWHRSVPRWALEHHFGNGLVTVSNRLSNFQRVYDLPHRVIGEAHMARRCDTASAHRELLAIAARASGIATVRDLADYFRMPTKLAVPRIAELVEDGILTACNVENWQEPAYVHRSVRSPKKLNCQCLLSPFDPLVWYRPRALRLFDFHYRIEIYVPAAKRMWGYYVLPFLLDDKIVARLDIKADRHAGELLILASHEEPGIDRTRVANALSGELQLLCEWLNLGRVRVSRKGRLARDLAVAVKRLS